MYIGFDPSGMLKLVELRQSEIRVQSKRGIFARRRFRLANKRGTQI